MDIRREGDEKLNEIPINKSLIWSSEKNKKKKDFKCCKEIIRFIFSQVGSVLLFLVFVFSGGFLFQFLESHASIQKCEIGQNMDKALIKKYSRTLLTYIFENLTSNARQKLVEEYANKTILNYPINQELYPGSKEIDIYIEEFRDKVGEIYLKQGYRGQDCILDTSWIIESSILFSISLLTTIGKNINFN